MGGVRIYHDQALYKQPGGGCTPWHAGKLAAFGCCTLGATAAEPESRPGCRRLLLSAGLRQNPDSLGAPPGRAAHNGALWMYGHMAWQISCNSQQACTQGPLEFAATSHQDDIGRHLGISGDSERRIQQAVQDAGYAVNATAFQLGVQTGH